MGAIRLIGGGAAVVPSEQLRKERKGRTMRSMGRIVGSCLIAWMVIFLTATPTHAADFTNAGFEDGTFNGWTLNGGYWGYGIGNYTYSGEQGVSAVVGVGDDPLLASWGVNIPMVCSGNYAARINNTYASGIFSTITQSAVWNDSHMYFAWSAILEEPGHEHDAEPHFLITLHDDTAGVDLYSIVIASDTAPQTFQTVGGYKYSGWQVVDLDVAAAGAVGHTLTLRLLASGCAYGAHLGYVYLDGFGAAPPEPEDKSPYELKDGVVSNLTELLPTSNTRYDKLLKSAIAEVKRSLRDAYWVDESHLALSGAPVFAHEYKAISDSLAKMLADPNLGTELRSDIEAAVDDLIEADRILARTALDEATANAGPGPRPQRELATALVHYNSGVSIADIGGTGIVRAIIKFRDSWLCSQRALLGSP
jgi:hypothetical protein